MGTEAEHRATRGYRRLLERARAALAAQTGGLARAVDAAKERTAELGELTREEADTVGDYLVRDIRAAAGYMAETGTELKDWLRFDLSLAEGRVLELFSGMVDETRLELDHLADQAARFGEWRTGEVVGIGTLWCNQCGQDMQFTAPARIPTCPRCHGRVFRRRPL